jgi:hypothetical protein
VPLGARAPVDPNSEALSVSVPVFNTMVRILDEDGAQVPAGPLSELATAVRSKTAQSHAYQSACTAAAAWSDRSDGLSCAPARPACLCAAVPLTRCGRPGVRPPVVDLFRVRTACRTAPAKGTAPTDRGGRQVTANDDHLPLDLEGLAIWATPGLVTDPSDPTSEPVAALTCVPSLSVHTYDRHPGAEPVDVIATTLLSQGFALLAALDLTALTQLPVLPGGR